MIYNSLADLKNKKGSYSHYSDYSDGANLQLAADMHENNQPSSVVNWKDDVHREKGAPNAVCDRYEDHTWSVASEYQWAVADNAGVVAGINYNWHGSLEDVKREKNGSVTHCDDSNQSAFNWQMMTKYHFEGSDTLALSYSSRTRLPTLKERYTISKPAYNQMALASPQLEPEHVRSVDLTWNGSLGKNWGLGVSIYHDHINDVTLPHNIDADTIRNQDNGRMDYTGLDAGIRGKVFDVLDVGLSCGLIHVDIKRGDIGKVVDSPT